MPISSQSAHIDGPLSNFSVAFLQDLTAFAGTRAFPTVRVNKQSDAYPIWDIESLLQVQSKERDEGTEAPMGSLKVSRDTYFCRSAALKLPVSDEARSNADEALELEQSVAEAVVLDIAQIQESRMTASCFSPNVWYNGGTAASAGSDVNWTGQNSPISDVDSARRGIWKRTGIRPNRMLLGPGAWDTIKVNEKILDMIQGGATTGSPAIATRELVARALELESVDVAGGVAKQGSADADFIASENSALLYFAPASAGRRTTTAATRFVWTPMGAEVATKRYREERLSSDVVESHLYVDYKVNAPSLGHLFIDVNA